jgi:T5SS/PEP-CTERM-associated repeat protein
MKNTTMRFVVAALFSTALSLNLAHGANYDWEVGLGNWSTAADWAPDGVPGLSDFAFVSNVGTVQVNNAQSVQLLELGRASSGAAGIGTLELLSGANLTLTTYELRMGRYVGGTGTVVHADGTLNAAAGVVVAADNASSRATYLMNGGTLNVTAGALWVGAVNGAGQGTFSHTAGTVGVNDLRIGAHAGGSGQYTMSGGTLTVGAGDTFFVGNASGVGTFTMSSGNASILGSAYIGQFGDSTGTVAVTGGTMTMSGFQIQVGRSGSSGQLTVNGGSVVASNTQILVGHDSISTRPGVLTISGGTFTVSSGNSLHIGAGGGYGTVDLTGGTFVHNGSSTKGANGLFNFTGGTLKGTGSLSYDLNNTGGTLAPGASAGTFTINGNYTQSSGTLLVELEGTTQSTQYDLLDINGTASLGGTLQVQLSSFTPAFGDLFEVVEADSAISSLFANAPVDGGTYNLGPGTFRVRYNVSGFGTAGNVILDQFTAVIPEPSTLFLLLLGGAALWHRRRLRK